MSKNYQKNPLPGTRNQPNPKPQQQFCKQGWECVHLLQKKCNFKHNEDDRFNAQSLQNIRGYKYAVLYIDIHSKKRPACLIEPDLPIAVQNEKEFNGKAGIYYQAIFIKIVDLKAIFKIERTLGEFGDYPLQKDLLSLYFPRIYKTLNKEKKDSYKGQIKVNRSFVKVLVGYKGEKIYLQKVNISSKYPLLHGCKVNYSVNNAQRMPQITDIEYPHQIRLCGIVQMDKNGQFYFISRNQSYDDMNPYQIPVQLGDKLKDYTRVFPYSMLKKQRVAQNHQKEVNSILKQFLVRGRYRGWPKQSQYPIIELIDEVQVRNFKSLKNGIIYETGIQITPFSKKQKTECNKIAEDFQIKKYLKNRTILRNKIYTIDSRQTKCYDDAIFIKQTEGGDFEVQIHIADVAELIKKDGLLDSSMKNRDQTIYIKNYYQPMIYDSLKNLFSLKKDEDKLAYSLYFKVNSKGFIDFSTIDFFKSVINVEFNLSHENIGKKLESYPELMNLNMKLDASQLIDSNYMLECQTKSEIALNKLIFISSIIPTYLFEINHRRVKQFKQTFDQFVKKMIEQKFTMMEKWEQNIKVINDVKKQNAKLQKQEKEIKKVIERQINKKRDQILKKLKNQQRLVTAQQKIRRKKQKALKKNEGKDLMSQSESQQERMSSSEGEIGDHLSVGQKQEKIIVQSVEDIIDENQQQKQKVKRQKAILKTKNIDALSDSESLSDDSADEDITFSEHQQFRINAAVNGKKYLEKIFTYFKIEVKWSSIKQINEAFNKILSLDKGKMYQQYFKRMQIMNRQHFKYIVNMGKNRQQERSFYSKNDKKDRISEQTGIDKRNQKRQSRRIQKKQQNLTKETNIKQDKKVQQKFINKTNQYTNTKPDNINSKKIPFSKAQTLSKVQIQPVNEEIIKMVKNKVSLNEQWYLQKYRQPFIAKQKLEYSDDQEIMSIFDGKERMNIKGIKMKTILNLLRQTYSKSGQQKEIKRQKKKDLDDSSILNNNSIQNEHKTNEQQLNTKQQRNNLKYQRKRNKGEKEMLHKDNNGIVFGKIMSYIRKDKQKYFEKYKIIKKKQVNSLSLNEIDMELMSTNNIEMQQYRIIKFRAIKKNNKQLQNNTSKISLTGVQQKKIIKNQLIEPSVQIDQLQKANSIQNTNLNEKLSDQMICADEQIQNQHAITKQENIVVKGKKKKKKISYSRVFNLLRPKQLLYIEKYKEKFDDNNDIDFSQQDEDRQYLVQRLDSEKDIYKTLKRRVIIIFLTKSKKNQIKQKPLNNQKSIINDSLQKPTAQIFELQANDQKDQEKKGQQIQVISGRTGMVPRLPLRMREPLVQNSQVAHRQYQFSNKMNIVADVSSQLAINRNEIEGTESLVKMQQAKEIQYIIKPIQAKSLKRSKKALLKQSLQLIKPEIQKIKLQHQQNLNKISGKVKENSALLDQETKKFREELSTCDKQYNIIQLLADSEIVKEQKPKKESKKKKEKKKEKQQKKDSIFIDLLDNLMSYAKKANYTYKKLTDEEIETYISQHVKINQISNNDLAKIQQINRQAFKMEADEQKLLKWNNPIRSHTSLRVMRLIKEFSWIFRSKLHPIDVINYHRQIKQIQRQLKQLQNYKNEKIEKGEMNKKSKQANRQISKLQFYNLLSKNNDAVHTFLNVSSPTPKVKMVYHTVLQELQIDNMNFQQEMYKQVKGKVKVFRDFPLQYRVVLIK